MRRIVLSLILGLAAPAGAGASQIAVGLDWRQNVFVQEIWQDGKPRYAIYNARPDAITLTVNDVQFANVPGTESFRAVDGKEFARWQIKGKGVLFVDAPKLAANGGLRFLRFRIANGNQLGVLSVPAAPAELPKGKIVSSDGMNGSGGRRQKTWYEQDSLTFRPEAVIEVKLKLAAGETITFKKTKSIDAPVEALITEAVCETLPIQAGKESITIDATKPVKEAPIHTVTLRFKAPQTELPIMTVIDGWVTTSPGAGYHAVRGVIVQPEK